MLKLNLKISAVLICAALSGCSDNTATNNSGETLIFSHDGIIENLGGDCSAVQVRTRSFGNFDFTNINKLKFNLSGMSDADLSSISIFYVENGNNVNLVNLTTLEQINNTNTIEVNSPRVNTELFSRVTLYSSVCTGQIYHITFRDLKIYSVN